MNKKILPIAIVSVIVVCFVLVAIQVQANMSSANSDSTQPRTESINARSGPEADPYLRHCPGCYDFENELPPPDLQLP